MQTVSTSTRTRKHHLLPYKAQQCVFSSSWDPMRVQYWIFVSTLAGLIASLRHYKGLANQSCCITGTFLTYLWKKKSFVCIILFVPFVQAYGLRWFQELRSFFSCLLYLLLLEEKNKGYSDCTFSLYTQSAITMLVLSVLTAQLSGGRFTGMNLSSHPSMNPYTPDKIHISCSNRYKWRLCYNSGSD